MKCRICEQSGFEDAKQVAHHILGAGVDHAVGVPWAKYTLNPPKIWEGTVIERFEKYKRTARTKYSKLFKRIRYFLVEMAITRRAADTVARMYRSAGFPCRVTRIDNYWYVWARKK